MRKVLLDLLALGTALLAAGAGGAAEPAGVEKAPGWRLGPTAWSFQKYTFFEAVEKTAALGMRYTEAFQGQRLEAGSDRVFDVTMPEEAIEAVERHLQKNNVRLVSLYIHTIPDREDDCRRIFDFARRLHLETLVSEPEPQALDRIERYCTEYDINLAIHNHMEGQSRYWHPDEALKVCQGRSRRVGVCADLGHYQRSGLDPVEAVRRLGGRLITLHVKDLNARTPDGHDVPWGTGQGRVAEVLREVHRLGLEPALFGIEYEYDWEDSMPEIGECRDFFLKTAGSLLSESTSK